MLKFISAGVMKDARRLFVGSLRPCGLSFMLGWILPRPSIDEAVNGLSPSAAVLLVSLGTLLFEMMFLFIRILNYHLFLSERIRRVYFLRRAQYFNGTDISLLIKLFSLSLSLSKRILASSSLLITICIVVRRGMKKQWFGAKVWNIGTLINVKTSFLIQWEFGALEVRYFGTLHG